MSREITTITNTDPNGCQCFFRIADHVNKQHINNNRCGFIKITRIEKLIELNAFILETISCD